MTLSVPKLPLKRVSGEFPTERVSQHLSALLEWRWWLFPPQTSALDSCPHFMAEFNYFSPSACICNSIVSGTTGASSANRKLLPIHNYSSSYLFCAGFSPQEAQTFHVGFSVEFYSNSRLGLNVPGEYLNRSFRNSYNCFFAPAEGRSPPWKTTITRARSPDSGSCFSPTVYRGKNSFLSNKLFFDH
jgi:hypothetical protein